MIKTLSATARRIRKKLRGNFIYYAPRCLKIRTKLGTITPFKLNKAQEYIHSCLEAQLKTKGHVRALIVKGRQQGCSTYVAARFFWKLSHRYGVQAFILSHLEVASRNLANVVKRFYEHCPHVVRPQLTQSNHRGLRFGHLDSGYALGTANSAGVGRSDTIQYFHGSEVAYWAHAKEHLSGILQSIPGGRETEVILESTSDGPQGLFYEMCQNAQKGQGDYQVIFVPWFWQDDYVRDVPPGFQLTSDETVYKKTYRLTKRQMVWRRQKILELGGEWMFRREYPASLEQAFHSDTPGALWHRDMIVKNRRAIDLDRPDIEFKRLVIAVDPAVSHTKNSDETGIIVAGCCEDDHVYILDDLSGIYTPAGWAQKTVEAFHFYKADKVIVEANQGGDMVVHTLKTCDVYVPVKKLYASRGKWTRAEPVAALDEQGRIHHIREFTKLEDQMCGFNPSDMRFSPDRVDARVWAVTELLLDTKKHRPHMWQA